MLVGIGVDTVDISRFEGQLARTPALRDRLFTEAERGLPLHSLAARFAAKEALVKALGGSGALGWQELEVVSDAQRAPSFARTAGLEREFAHRGITEAHLSMAHDGGIATAFVILERITNGAER